MKISHKSSLGTVEFRQHEGTLNIDDIINWVQFVIQFVSYSRKVSIINKKCNPVANIFVDNQENRKYDKVRTEVERIGCSMKYKRMQWVCTCPDGTQFTISPETLDSFYDVENYCLNSNFVDWFENKFAMTYKTVSPHKDYEHDSLYDGLSRDTLKYLHNRLERFG